MKRETKKGARTSKTSRRRPRFASLRATMAKNERGYVSRIVLASFPFGLRIRTGRISSSFGGSARVIRTIVVVGHRSASPFNTPFTIGCSETLSALIVSHADFSLPSFAVGRPPVK